MLLTIAPPGIPATARVLCTPAAFASGIASGVLFVKLTVVGEDALVSVNC